MLLQFTQSVLFPHVTTCAITSKQQSALQKLKWLKPLIVTRTHTAEIRECQTVICGPYITVFRRYRSSANRNETTNFRVLQCSLQHQLDIMLISVWRQNT